MRANTLSSMNLNTEEDIAEKTNIQIFEVKLFYFMRQTSFAFKVRNLSYSTDLMQLKNQYFLTVLEEINSLMSSVIKIFR